MCGKATLAIVLSTPCMIVASMIEAVIIPRFATCPRPSPLLTLAYPSLKQSCWVMISPADEFCIVLSRAETGAKPPAVARTPGPCESSPRSRSPDGPKRIGIVKGRDNAMKTSLRFPPRIATFAAALLTVAPASLSAQQTPQPAVRIAEHDLGGVVTGKNGPETGVWVIAETNGLPTPFAKIVVTDDQGRYLVPDLPSANYDVWVRGYGLVDSPKVVTTPGKIVNLQAVP